MSAVLITSNCLQVATYDSGDSFAHIRAGTVDAPGISCDTATDLPAQSGGIPGVFLEMESTAHVISDNTIYTMMSDGSWIIQDQASRMDVYTKTEVDNIASNLDYKISINRGLIVDLINTGHKNLAQLQNPGGTWYGTTFDPDFAAGTLTTSGTASGYKSYRFMGDLDNIGYSYAVPISRGKYTLRGVPSGASSSTFRLILGIYADSAATRQTVYIYDNDYILEVDNDTTRIDLAVYVSQGNVFTNPVVWRPYLVNVQLNAITDAFVPYSPTLHDLYVMVRNYHP